MGNNAWGGILPYPRMHSDMTVGPLSPCIVDVLKLGLQNSTGVNRMSTATLEKPAVNGSLSEQECETVPMNSTNLPTGGSTNTGLLNYGIRMEPRKFAFDVGAPIVKRAENCKTTDFEYCCGSEFCDDKPWIILQLLINRPSYGDSDIAPKNNM